ncbi:GNAT family N-acetyltransferase [Algivirga pacifica]|uniref:GNAT family N-acetyltransferase n=1 Tax=Algivirga pacifica TaxID=1162670 RepID=A0ABP9CZ26_9BACT
MEIQIRQANQQDLASIADFQLTMAWETESLKLDLPTVRQGVAHILNNPEIGCYWVAEYQGEVIACLLNLYEWSDWRNGNVLWIHSLFVKDPYKGQGVFRQMYDFLKERVQNDPDLRGIRLYVEKTNLNAQKVYEAIGMTKEHYDLYEWLA